MKRSDFAAPMAANIITARSMKAKYAAFLEHLLSDIGDVIFERRIARENCRRDIAGLFWARVAIAADSRDARRRHAHGMPLRSGARQALGLVSSSHCRR